MKRRARSAFLVAALLAGAGAIAHVRLVTGGGAPLFWSTPSNISIVVNATGSDDIGDGSHFTALRNAFDAWNRASGSSARLVENKDPVQQARTDWGDDALHLVFFDETNSTGFFPNGTGIVAITPVWFLSSGRITDADVLFDGANFAFTTRKSPGAFDVQDVATHELGHLLGLDHSGWAGATMYPYVDTSVILHRSLSQDEVHGVRDAFPATSFGVITGTIRRQLNGSPVSGAHVVARDAQGRTAAGALANTGGVFRLAGLESGSYTVYATPLDSPVSSGNLSPGHPVQTDFESTVLGVMVATAGQTLQTGDLTVETDVAFSIGRNSDRFPLRCVIGQPCTQRIRGAGLDASTTLVASDPSIDVQVTALLGTQINFTVTVPPGAAIGHADLVATDLAGHRSILPAALEITPADPVLVGVTPGAGATTGGTSVTITGSGFHAGARVVLGGNVYVDGDPGGCTVIDDSTIALTTLPTEVGAYDAVVIDASGVEGRELAAFEFVELPVIQSIFPAAGSASGGTTVRIRGSSFLAGAEVRIDGVLQAQVSVDDPTRITVVTSAGVPGGPYTVEVENPGGSVATTAFVYSPDPDPTLDSIAPALGLTMGGDTITITGTNLQPTSDVWFGADVETGLGGVQAAMVSWIDANTLEVVTPAHAVGATSVMVQDDLTGQSAVVASAFTFHSAPGGGGGCSIAPSSDGPRSRWDPLAGSAWLLLLLAILGTRAVRSRRPAPAVVARSGFRR